MRAVLLAMVLSGVVLAATDVAAAQAVNPIGLPVSPTTKVLAMGHFTPGALASGAMKPVMPSEVRETVKLYLAGKIDQWYIRQDKPEVVFLLNVTNVEEARAMLEKLPLGVQN